MKVQQVRPISKGATRFLQGMGAFLIAFILVAAGFLAPAHAGAETGSSGTVTGGEWVNVRSIPSIEGNARGRIDAGESVPLDCYVHGEPVEGPSSSSDIWYKVASTRTKYVSSLYITTFADLSQCAIGPRLRGPEARAVYCGDVTCTVYWDRKATSQLRKTMKAAVAGEHLSTIAVCGTVGFAVGGPAGAIGVPVLCEAVALHFFDHSEDILRAAENAHSARGCYETELYEGEVIRHGHTTDSGWCG